jgi:hypothetical protein
MELIAAAAAAIAAAIAAAKAIERQNKEAEERRVKIPVRADENVPERRTRK